MVDVQLAVDALLMASRGLFGSVTLITGDLDFKPLVNALVDMGVDVHLTYPAGETSEELIAAADSAAPLSINQVQGWLNRLALPIELPSARHDFRSELGKLGEVAVADWHDERYGRCLVLPSGSRWKLITEKEPRTDTHNLEIVGTSRSTVRHYAADLFDLDIPPE